MNKVPDIEESEGEAPVGYRRPPQSTKFQKGKSGNPRGRPKNRKRSAPYDTILGQMVTIRESGKDRRVTAAEAFLLHLVRKGLGGDSAAARASLAAIEAARQRRRTEEDQLTVFRIILMSVSPGSIALGTLGMAVKKHPGDEHKVQWELKPWIVELALARLGSRQLTADAQREVWNATLKPDTVRWPEWWTERG